MPSWFIGEIASPVHCPPHKPACLIRSASCSINRRVSDCEFAQNWAGINGGGFHVFLASANYTAPDGSLVNTSITMQRCAFSGNSGLFGGGATFTNVRQVNVDDTVFDA